MAVRKVAIAGGTSNVGREIIDRIVARGQVELIVLTTRKTTDLELPESVKAITVDYDYPASLASALDGVNTVISFIAVPDIQLFASVQIKLIDACVANGVKRFAPSEWATCEKGEPRHYRAKVIKIECSLFQPGFFTNYLALTRPTTKHFFMQEMFIDFAGRRALQTEDVDADFVLTTVEDTAEITARAVEYNREWPEIGGMCGQKMKVLELIKLGEDLQGPFTISKVRYAELDQRQQASEWVFRGYMIFVAKGGWSVSDEWNRIFPDYKFISAEEYVRKV